MATLVMTEEERRERAEELPQDERVEAEEPEVRGHCLTPPPSARPRALPSGSHRPRPRCFSLSAA